MTGEKEGLEEGWRTTRGERGGGEEEVLKEEGRGCRVGEEVEGMRMWRKRMDEEKMSQRGRRGEKE